MKAMMHLMFYFAKEKEQCFPWNTQEEEIIGYVKEMFENI